MGKKYHLEVIIGATSKVGRALKQVGSELKAEVSRIGSAITRARDAIELGKYAVDGAKMLAGLAKEASDYGSTVNDIAQRTGLATSTIQELGHAAELAGASAEEWGGALDTVTKNMGMLLANKGKLKTFLGEVAGPGFAKALKAAKPDERLDLIFGAMLQIEDPAKRAAFAVEFFGEAGAKLAPLANEGADGIARMRKEARDLGLVMDGDTVGAMDEFGDETAKLEAGWKGVKRQIGAALAQEFLPLVKDAVGWLKSHQPEVKAFAHDFAVGVRDAVEGIGSFLSKLDGAGPIIAGVGAALGLAFAPITTALAAVGALIIALDDFSKKNSTDQKKTIYEGFKNVGESGGLGLIGQYVAQPGGIIDRGLADVATEQGMRSGATSATIAAAINAGDVSNALARRARVTEGSYALPGFGSVAPGPLEVKLVVQDPNGLLGQPRVDAPAGTKVTTKKLATGARGTARP